jgi:hypothetical protein
MEIAALVAWILTALGGFFLLGTWIQKGGLRQQGTGRTRFPAPVVFGHMLLAAAGLVVWIVYVAADSGALAWTAVVLLVLVAALGLTMFARWLPVRRSATVVPVDVPAEKHLPLAAVAGHGVVAVVTVVLVVLAAAGVG